MVDTAGDSILAVFGTAAGALQAALAIQKALAETARALPEEQRMRFRIGVHLGDVIEKPDGSVYGDGVNIAARLQALAEPGGIMVSEAVRGVAKSAAAFEDRGEHRVKNIGHPVRAFAIRLDAATARPRHTRAAIVGAVAAGVVAAAGLAAQHWMTRTAGVAQPPPFAVPARPSIAVLPFDNIGGDPEQAYFADGMTEDLTTDLSKIQGMFVIASNSTFPYKGKTGDARGIARALGVRYVLQGSVRRSGDEVRVNATLVDATTGGNVWADRYDGNLTNIFALQDKVTRSVVNALAVQLTREDNARVARKGKTSAEAYDVFLRGWQHYLKQTPEDFRAAIDDFNRSVELDPNYSRAYAALAATYWQASTRIWEANLGLKRQHEARALAGQFLAKAMRDPTPLAHQVASAMALQDQRYDDAIAEAKKALDEHPNDPDGYVTLASALAFTGNPGEALELVDRAIRINPHYPADYLYQRGLAQFGLKNLAAAATSLEDALRLNPEDYWSQRLLLSVYGSLGRAEQAARLYKQIKAAAERRGMAFLDPVTVSAVSFWYPFQSASEARRFAEGLRKSGVPD